MNTLTLLLFIIGSLLTVVILAVLLVVGKFGDKNKEESSFKRKTTIGFWG